jgi:signal transduction histidine kinase
MIKAPSSHVRNLAIGYIAVLGFAALGLGALGYVQARDSLTRDLDAGIEKRMHGLEKAYRVGGRDGLARSIAQFSERGARTFAYLLVDARGRRIVGIRNLTSPAPGWGMVSIYDEDDQSEDPARTLTARLDDGARLTVMADQDYIERFDETLVRLFAFGAALFIALAAAGGIALEKTISRRLEPLKYAANAISSGSLSHRIPIGASSDEFDRIGRAFNAMIERIDTLVTEIQRTSSFIAHDLRSPLVKLHDALNIDADCRIDHAHCMDRITAAKNRSIELIALFDAILRISRVGDGFFIHTVIDLSEITTALAESYGVVAEDAGGHLDFDSIAPNIIVRADAHLLTQLVVNLLDNSIRYGSVGGRITVSLFVRQDSAILEIENDIADPQYEQTAAAESERASTFGLALVRAIATAHKGQIETICLGKRFRATATLPIFSESE